MNKLFSLVLVLISTAIFSGCELFTEPTYIDGLAVLDADQRDGNLEISTLSLSEDFVLCADGEAVGVVPSGIIVRIGIEILEDSLKNLWLVPVSLVASEADLIIENCQYCWVAKLYVDSEVRSWNPGGDNSSDTSLVTFIPNAMGSQEWDYVIGYINDDDTYLPVAVLSPADKSGVEAYLEFGRTSITWKFYQSNPENSSESALISEITEEFILTEDDLSKTVELPLLESESESEMSLSISNSENYIISIYLNGSLIEDSMADSKAGYSYLDAYESRTFEGLEIQAGNTIVVTGDSGELASFTFTAEDGDVFSFIFSETGGLAEL